VEKLYTVKEMARILNINEGTLYHWISAQRVKVVRFSKRCVRFRMSDVDALLETLSAADQDSQTRRKL
jgi:excisionase family DNA binding protein